MHLIQDPCFSPCCVVLGSETGFPVKISGNARKKAWIRAQRFRFFVLLCSFLLCASERESLKNKPGAQICLRETLLKEHRYSNMFKSLFCVIRCLPFAYQALARLYSQSPIGARWGLSRAQSSARGSGQCCPPPSPQTCCKKPPVCAQSGQTGWPGAGEPARNAACTGLAGWLACEVGRGGRAGRQAYWQSKSCIRHFAKTGLCDRPGGPGVWGGGGGDRRHLNFFFFSRLGNRRGVLRQHSWYRGGGSTRMLNLQLFNIFMVFSSI